MEYFIGIVPPDEELRAIKKFRNQWTANGIDAVVEPHFTLKAQGGLTADESWIEKVEEVAAEFPDFTIELGEPRFFGADILYISTDSKELKYLHESLVKAVGATPEQIEQYFEMGHFVAHLTLAKTAYGLSKQELKEMAAAAKNKFSPYTAFQARSIRIYRKTDDRQGYTKYMDIPLKNGNTGYA